MRYLYTLLLWLLTPFIMAKLVYRGLRAPAYWQRWPERFGYFSCVQTELTLWVHAVSVGEVQAAVPLIEALKKQYPQYPIVVTTMTPTGLAQVRRQFGDSVICGYLPYDFPAAIQRFLKRSRPVMAIVMETELWPNLFHSCKELGIPLMIANGRLSPGSTRGYKRIQPFVRQVLGHVSCIAAQSEADAQRFVEIGGDPAKIVVTKNIKFDIELPEKLDNIAYEFRCAFGGNKRIWIAASTHAGEDELILDAYDEVLKSVPGVVLLLVPRHPERFNEVSALAQARGFVTSRRSQDGLANPQTQVFIGDSMGEMMLYYHASDLVFVGGSLVPTGGHNILEPAALGLMSLVGPHTFNFRDITQTMVHAGATLQVATVAELIEHVIELLRRDEKRQAMGKKAERVVLENRGATNLLLQRVVELLSRS